MRQPDDPADQQSPWASAFFLGLPIYLYFFAPRPLPIEYIYVSGGIIAGSIALAGYGWHVTFGGDQQPRVLRSGRAEQE